MLLSLSYKLCLVWLQLGISLQFIMHSRVRLTSMFSAGTLWDNCPEIWEDTKVKNGYILVWNDVCYLYITLATQLVTKWSHRIEHKNICEKGDDYKQLSKLGDHLGLLLVSMPIFFVLPKNPHSQGYNTCVNWQHTWSISKNFIAYSCHVATIFYMIIKIQLLFIPCLLWNFYIPPHCACI